MPNLVIYAPRYKNQAGKVMQAFLKINAANNLKYYRSYRYFSLLLGEKKNKNISDLRDQTCNELLTRARRLITFTDTSELKPTKYSKKYFGNIADRVHKAGSCDHLSFWLSYWNTKFVLNEPYDVHPEYMMKLAAQGLVAIELPNGLSPYCGGWNPTHGAKPWTRSFLICDVNDLDELEMVIRELTDASMKVELIPAWNSLEGITHA